MMTPPLIPLRRILHRKVGFLTIRQTTQVTILVGVMVTEGAMGVVVRDGVMHPSTGGTTTALHRTVRLHILHRLTSTA